MTILIQCTDKVGLVAGIANVLTLEKINIVSMREHVDEGAKRFFVRLKLEQVHCEADTIKQALQQILPADAEIQIANDLAKKIVVLVSKEYHCLSDILVRNHFNTLGGQVHAVIGNHPQLGDICYRFKIPFHHISHEAISKETFESHLLETIQSYNPDWLVLAKFMRILSPGFVLRYPHRIINIHHSFLPAFVGANPYRQAYERGVKIIGATAHFVTNELDEGPIITQQIIPVNHSYTVTDMVRAGKEIETAVLAQALHLVLEDRVLVYENKTVVFS